MFDLEKREKAIILFFLTILLIGLSIKLYQRSNQIIDLKVRGFGYEGVAKREEKININKADEETLAKLSGIGPLLAKRIAAYRTENGYFGSVEELKKVKGIGEKLFEKIKHEVSIE